MFLYNIGIALFELALRIASAFNPKVRLMLRGRRGIFERLKHTIDRSDRVVWVHCASLGEFEQGRPIIEAMREQMPNHKILLTFFSPSGYEVRKGYKGADYVFYLPLDTRRNARRFMEVVRPEIAVFIKYEFWLNYLKALRKAKCPTFIVAAIFRPKAVFFRWYGGVFRRGLESFETLFVQDEASQELLATIGIDRVVVGGDTRFDRVATIAGAAKEIDIVARFAMNSRVFVAGSTWAPDEALVMDLATAHLDIKFIIIPHEIDHSRIDKLCSESSRSICKYSECSAETDLKSLQILVVDSVGLLSSIYQYADYAYIGGGFGVGIHNTLEAATFGLPIVFGPNYEKFNEAKQMIELGAARSIEDFSELDAWFVSLATNPELYADTRRKALDYIAQHRGATAVFIEHLKRFE